MTGETPTHEPRPTLTREQAGEAARSLVLEIRDLLKNEELWFVAKQHLDRAYQRGLREGLMEDLE